MRDKLIDALNTGKLTLHDLESAGRVFQFLADSLKEVRVELEVQGYEGEVEKLIRERQIIPAIKLLRSHTPGMGLKEAKDAVEAMGERLGVRQNGQWAGHWK